MAMVVAIVLAAGASSRFGERNKLLANLGGKIVIRRVTEAVLRGGIDHIVVVTGDEAAALEHVLADLSVRFVRNDDWRQGMGTSISAGLSALDVEADGVLIVPGDLGLLTPSVIATLIAAFAETGGQRLVYAATCRGEQRNPVLWPRRLFAELGSLSGAHGGKSILARFMSEATAIPFEDERVFLDIDTVENLHEAERLLAAS